MTAPQAVFFDVDFTLIHPGRRFQGAGYAESCARHGIEIEAELFNTAVAEAASVLNAGHQLYDDELFVRYTARIIELMGGRSPAIDLVARELYAAWAEHEHFSLYDDAKETMTDLVTRGVRLGIISNSHRCLDSFRTHFELDALISASVSSSEIGFLKPHPEIFQTALRQLDVDASQAVMVGDSLTHDIEGAIGVGMRGVLLARGGALRVRDDVPVITTLRDLPAVLF